MDRLTGEKNSSVFSWARTQEIIERLEAYEDTGKTPEEIRELEIRSMSLADKAMYLMGELLNERKKTRWISVSERMPESNTEVMVIVSGQYMGKKFENAPMFAVRTADDWIIHGYEWWMDADVKAWFMLPEFKEKIK